MKLVPDFQFEKVLDISPQWLAGLGVGAVALDLDNTLAAYAEREFSPGVLRWLGSLRQNGFRIVVVTNNREKRAEGFCAPYGIPFVNGARKPFKNGLLRAAELLDTSPRNMVMIGDQVFTDSLGAHRCGMISIVVKPLHMGNILLKLRHFLEQPFLKKGKCVTDEQ